MFGDAIRSAAGTNARQEKAIFGIKARQHHQGGRVYYRACVLDSESGGA